MKNLTPLCLLFAGVLALQACDDNQKAKNYNDKTLVDQQGLAFIKTANEAGLTEIKVSTLAETMSKNPRVIGFAKMMIADHTQAGKELTQLADKKLVDKSDSVKTEHQKTIDSLSKLTDSNFDKGYMNMMVKDHEAGVNLFKDATNNKNSAVQKFAKNILPTLQMHLDSAKAIYSSLK